MKIFILILFKEKNTKKLNIADSETFSTFKSLDETKCFTFKWYKKALSWCIHFKFYTVQHSVMSHSENTVSLYGLCAGNNSLRKCLKIRLISGLFLVWWVLDDLTYLIVNKLYLHKERSPRFLCRKLWHVKQEQDFCPTMYLPQSSSSTQTNLVRDKFLHFHFFHGLSILRVHLQMHESWEMFPQPPSPQLAGLQTYNYFSIVETGHRIFKHFLWIRHFV